MRDGSEDSRWQRGRLFREQPLVQSPLRARTLYRHRSAPQVSPLLALASRVGPLPAGALSSRSLTDRFRLCWVGWSQICWAAALWALASLPARVTREALSEAQVALSLLPAARLRA